MVLPSNDNLNLWEEIKLMPLLQKGTTLDPTVVSPAQALAAATSVGAKAMGYDTLGMLKEGYIADLILVDTRTPHMTPNMFPESNLIYALQGSDVKLTNGGRQSAVPRRELYDHRCKGCSPCRQGRRKRDVPAFPRR